MPLATNTGAAEDTVLPSRSERSMGELGTSFNEEV
jgi:hypothetical protein